MEGDGRLGFVGERGRVLILADEGRGWLPTGRPAEGYPVAAVLDVGWLELRDHRIAAGVACEPPAKTKT